MSATTDSSATPAPGSSASAGDPGSTPPGTDTTVVPVPVTLHRRRSWVLLALGLFQLWLWTTRLVNLVNDPEPRTVGFVVVHAVLYTAAFGAGFLLLGLGWRLRREARRAADGAPTTAAAADG